jgi:hypothetical protein
VYARLKRDPMTKEFIARIETLRMHALAAGDVAPSCVDARSPEATGRPTPIDGVYDVTTTAKELLGAGSPDANPDNYGHWTLVFDRGWFRWTQKSHGAQTWASGTFRVSGNTMVWINAAVGGVKPNGANCCVGDRGVFRWSLYRGLLTLSGNPALNYEVKPWRRVADSPSDTFRTPVSMLEGVWTSTWTAKQQVAADRAAIPNAGDVLPQNNGLFYLAFHNGRFWLGRTAVERRPIGTYQVLGDAIRFRTRDGQRWDYTWSIDRGRLRLIHPPGDPVHEHWNLGVTLSPWRRS